MNMQFQNFVRLILTWVFTVDYEEAIVVTHVKYRKLVLKINKILWKTLFAVPVLAKFWMEI